MTEADYWQHLEYRVCREFAGLENKALRFFWCDGFIPKRYFVDDPLPRITGLAWIGSAPKSEEWAFELVLSGAVPRREDVVWDALMPPEDATGWLSIDVDERRIRIIPPRRAA